MNKLLTLLNKCDFAAADTLIKSEDININSFENSEWMDTDYCGGGHKVTTNVSYITWAFENGRLDIAEYFLKKGANVRDFVEQILQSLRKRENDFATAGLRLLVTHKGEYLFSHYKSIDGNNFSHFLATFKPGQCVLETGKRKRVSEYKSTFFAGDGAAEAVKKSAFSMNCRDKKALI